MKNMKKSLFLSVLLIFISSVAFADCPDGDNADTIFSKLESIDRANADPTEIVDLIKQYKDCKKQAEDNEDIRKFFGINWGVGFAFTGLNTKSIDEAKVINGVVRTTKSHKRAATAMLETHFLFDIKKLKESTGLGPFAAIRVADTEGNDVGAFGVGLMLGCKTKKSSTLTLTKSWNFGVGFFVDLEAQEYGSGIKEGQALPTGETEPRLIKSDCAGWMVMLSSTF